MSFQRQHFHTKEVQLGCAADLFFFCITRVKKAHDDGRLMVYCLFLQAVQASSWAEEKIFDLVSFLEVFFPLSLLKYPCSTLPLLQIFLLADPLIYAFLKLVSFKKLDIYVMWRTRQ